MTPNVPIPKSYKAGAPQLYGGGAGNKFPSRLPLHSYRGLIRLSISFQHVMLDVQSRRYVFSRLSDVARSRNRYRLVEAPPIRQVSSIIR